MEEYKMRSKIIAPLCAAVVALSGTSLYVITGSADANLNAFEPTADNVKILGRAYYTGESLRFAQTAAGVEFETNASTVSFTLSGESGALSRPEPARMEIYIDGKLDSLHDLGINGQVITVDLGEKADHIVRIIKTTESENGTVFLDEIAVDSDSIAPTPAKERKIEFIGDSITCGYGLGADKASEHFTTKTEYGSRTYAYKAAQLLDADYSMVCFSGFGLVSGYTANGVKNEISLLPTYYEKCGLAWEDYYGGNTAGIDSVDWDFSQYVPDLIVINLGTNDNSYVSRGADADEKAARAQEYVDAYVAFLKQVRENNPDSEILCTLGTMGQELWAEVEKTVETYTAETGDTKVKAMEFDNQDPNDGYGADYHPTEVTHAKAAHQLADYISAEYGWTIDETVDVSATPIPEAVPAPRPSTSKPDSSSQAAESSSAEDSSSAADSSSASSAAASSAASTSSKASSSASAGTSNPDTGFGLGAAGIAAAAVTAAGIVVSRKRKDK